MIVALLIVIILILLFGAAAVKSAIARTAMFVVAVCIGGIGIGTIRWNIVGGGSTVLLALVSAMVLVGGALVLAAVSLPNSAVRKGWKTRSDRARRRQRLEEIRRRQDL